MAVRASEFTASPYNSFADSPFSTLSGVSLDDLESSTRTAGYSANSGFRLGPGSLTDSVDGDDGSIDGSGHQGHSWYSNNAMTLTFTFDKVGGLYPTHVGAVWTDIGFDKNGGLTAVGDLSFEAFDATGASLDVFSPFAVGDGRFDGTTADDVMVGAIHLGGISSLSIYSDSGDWEVDHVQFATVPDPATMSVLGMGLAGFLARRRKKA